MAVSRKILCKSILILTALLLIAGCPNPTDSGGADTVVNALDLTGLITAPVKDAAPVTAFAEQTQYTGVIVWQKADDSSAVTGSFAASTAYKAVVTLTAKTGFTFTGVAANAFVYSGATATNAADSGTVTIVFVPFVAVTGIDGIPATRNAITGSLLDLNVGVSVVPAEATQKDIVWSVKTAGTTGLTSADVASGSFTPASAGTATLTATIVNGKAQGDDFTAETTITIIKPVTSIANVPAYGTKDYAVSLAGATPIPGDATNKTIVWTVKTSGAGVSAITDNSFTPTATGTVTLTATIADGSGLGTPFTSDYTITINELGAVTPGVGLGEDTSITLKGTNGNVTVDLSKDAEVTLTVGDVYYVSINTAGGSYTDIAWRLNGTKQEGITGSLIFLDTSTAKTIKLTVEGKTSSGDLESSGTYTFTINN
ncbi:MAG: hypothetical protein LBG26_05935 [Treponema sp.]|jgi:hypothetical protein|nr:hypothetical protein [Treponema sp.]